MESVELDFYTQEYLKVCTERAAGYDTYAKKMGFSSYSTLSVLRIILEYNGDCTQKIICERTFLPKQTVNAIVTSLLTHGAIEMTESNVDRRQKMICFTKIGQEFAFESVQKLKTAEKKAMDCLDENQKQAMLTATKAYVKCLQDLLLE